jgi:hypothetical protein
MFMARRREQDKHGERGEMRLADPRQAALSLLTLLLVAQLHQGELSGAGCRPLDMDGTPPGNKAGPP